MGRGMLGKGNLSSLRRKLVTRGKSPDTEWSRWFADFRQEEAGSYAGILPSYSPGQKFSLFLFYGWGPEQPNSPHHRFNPNTIVVKGLTYPDCPNRMTCDISIKSTEVGEPGSLYDLLVTAEDHVPILTAMCGRDGNLGLCFWREGESFYDLNEFPRYFGGFTVLLGAARNPKRNR